MALEPGSRFGRYEIESLIGEGAMGLVYRATDTTLGRTVAIKILQDAIATHDRGVMRFEREAEVLAKLNHPNIAQIYGLEHADDVRALVMESVDGPTLADRLVKGALPIAEALRIAKQIATALAAAHEQRIVHRDLKPANVKVRPDGTVKVLDFGLAKEWLAANDEFDASHVETVSAPDATALGTVLGTAAYMSPEQARGIAADRRSDLWAFGVVLYEMLAGVRLFHRPTIAQTIAAVVADEPQWTLLPAATPPPIRRLLHRCLERDHARRLDSATAAALEIDDALSATGAELVSRAKRRIWPWAVVSGGAAALLASLTTAVLVRQTAADRAPVTRTTIAYPAAFPLEPQGVDRDLALAPDGSFLVYRAGSQAQLVVRRLDELEAAPLPGVANARGPFVSPDGRWIGYVENNTTLKKIAVRGGLPITLAQLPGSPRGAAWVDDQTLVVATNATGLLRVPAEGGGPTELTKPDQARGEQGHMFPSAVPGGHAVLFTILAERPEDAQVAVLDLATNRHTTVLRGGSDARYIPSGHLAFARAGALSAVRFNLATRQVVGSPVPVVERVSMTTRGAMNASVTDVGTLVYAPADAGRVAERSLVWMDRQARETSIPAPAGAYTSARLSPHGTHVALEVNDPMSNIWIWDLVRRTLTRTMFDGGIAPVWSPDGRRLVYARAAGAQPPNLYAQAADGRGPAHRLTSSANVQVPASITPDGAFVVAVERRAQTGSDLVLFALTRPADAVASRLSASKPLIEQPFTEQNGEVSPDGRFLAYESNESGRFEIYVRPYPRVADGRWQISLAGGTRPAWTRAGREVVYLDAANHLTAVPVEIDGAAVRAGAAATLTTTSYATTIVAWRTYDISPNGERFLVLKEETGVSKDNSQAGFVVVHNWLDELRRAVPVEQRR